MEKLRNFRILTTHDLDEARAAVSSTYLDNRLTKLSKHTLRFSLNASEAYDVTVGYLTYASEVNLQMPPSGDFYHVNLTTGGNTDAWRDDRQSWQTSAGDSGVILLPERLSRVTWSHDAEQVIFRFSRQRLEGCLAGLLAREVSRPIEFELRLNLRTEVGASLYATALQMVDELDRLQSGPGFLQMIQPMEELIMTQLLYAAQHNYSAELRAMDSSSIRPCGGRRVDKRLQSIQEYIDAHLDEQMSLEQIAAVSRVSIRTLQGLFRSALGTSPRRYIRDQRLLAVRAELESAAEVDSVSSVSTRWGFTHLGRFASAYNEYFGELPSTTLRRRSPVE
ncbi:AraC family transcriptional regulator [Brevibacterium yomogidense]|uniref:AraC family transcriptional regulator n=1 Tax=Brevibacterium yomogidense TaxID=946573 RepID=UPI0018DFB614|nr:AraC family transcriptional regulator [Brevibacterium yomogidense]